MVRQSQYLLQLKKDKNDKKDVQPVLFDHVPLQLWHLVATKKQQVFLQTDTLYLSLDNNE